MKRPLYIIPVFAIFAAACHKETERPYTIDGPEIMAYQETGAGIKTLVEVNDGVGTIYWKPSEKINVFYGTTSTEYISKNKVNTTVASFKTNDIIGATEESSTNIWGLYPYDEDAECNGSKVTTTIAATQYGVPETFDDNLFTTLAHSETRELRFYNVCGGIKFSLSRADITKITFKGNNNETLAGKVDLIFAEGVPVATSVEAAATITLTPKTGSTFAKDVNYYIVTLPASMTGGFTMTFETETKIGTFNYTEKAVTVTRSKFGIKSNIDTYATFVDRGPVAVDLGLPSGTKWADVNLSGYYAWGETTTKSNYSWNNYSLGDGTAFTQVKYGYGEILLPEDDAATQAYGPDWKIPTREQWQELKNECTWILETDNKRYKVSSKVNSNYIYIPAEYHSNCPQEYKTTLIMFSYWQSDFYDALYHTGGLHEIIGSDEDEVGYAQTESCAVGVASGRSVRAVSGGVFIYLSSSELVIEKGKSSQLSAIVLPSDLQDKSLNWSSSDTGVAMVDNAGNVSGIEVGICKIAATTKNGGKAECRVVVVDLNSMTDLSLAGTANCYIVSKEGLFKFKATVKGGSTESVGAPVSAITLWESFGTSQTPPDGSIVNFVGYFGDYVAFGTSSSLNNGNAVIAVKDASDNILWSWHIWVCKDFDPAATAQVYYNSAGTMMDRNLGATSATPGDVQSLGLLYQWGRKDPFLSGYSISSNDGVASSTLSWWPMSVSSNSSSGTISYAVAHPTTFINGNNSNYDWYYTGSSSTDNTRWQTFDKTKGIYDPCPQGWRVPDGGENGLWSKAFGSSSYFSGGPFDITNNGMDFGSGNRRSSSHQLGSASIIWYPAAGRYERSYNHRLCDVGIHGYYWSCTPNGRGAYCLNFERYGNIYPSYSNDRACGKSVRCVKIN